MFLFLFIYNLTYANIDSQISEQIHSIQQNITRNGLNQLTPNQKIRIKNKLNDILDLLNGNNYDQNVICVVSSNHSSYYRLHNGRREIGNDSNQTECIDLAQNSINDLVCGRSLNHSSYFRVYSTKSARSIGADSNQTRCLQLIRNSNKNFTCAVSTNHTSYYSIYNKLTSQRIGGDMSLENCLLSLNQK
jgi:hypothetical protein